MGISYFNVWKKKMENNGGSVVQSRINDSNNFVNNNFKEDPSYKLAILIKKDKITIDSDLDTRIINDVNNPLKKKLYVKPNTLIEAGDYIKYPNKSYIVLSFEDNLISPVANSEECNHLLKFMFDGNLNTMCSIVTNNTKYTLGVKTQVAGIIEGDGMFGVILPYDDMAKKIHLGQRFLINEQAWKATQTDHTTTKGLLAVLLGEDSINTETDDLILGIANYKTAIPHTYTYNIPTSIEVSKDNVYSLVYSIKDNNKDIDYSLVSVSTDSILVQVTNTNGVIIVKGLNAGIGTIKLTSTLSGETKESIISFEIKEILVNQVDYTTNFSQGTSLKTLVSSTFLATKKINGVLDNSLYMDYTLDLVGTTLLNSGKMTITRKTDSSVQLKNVSVSAKTTFTMTATDRANGNVILTQLMTFTNASGT